MINFIKTHKLLSGTLVYSIPVILYIVIKFSAGITFENNNLDNVLQLTFFLIPITVIYWISFIRTEWLMQVIMVGFGLLSMAFYISFFLVFLIRLNDVINLNNNGFRAIYQVPIDNNKRIVIYRTPDRGGFGGDFIDEALVNDIGFGLIKRNFSNEINYEYRYSEHGGKIFYKGKEYDVPPLSDIEHFGELE